LRIRKETLMRAFMILLMVALAGGCATVAAVETEPPVVLTEAIPPGHLPPPGQCRIWFPGDPPGQQPPPGSCADLEWRVPLGAWLIYGPSERYDDFVVSVYDRQLPNVVISIRYYDAKTGRFLSEKPIHKGR
jgi:hypothetical protein